MIVTGGGGNQQTGEYVGVKGQGMEQVHYGKPTSLPTPGMCFYHREIPAAFVCSKCGRAICNSCDKTYGPLHFCPQCNPFPGAAPAPAAQPLPPRGRGLFITGAVGSILMGLTALIFGFIPFICLMENGGALDFDDLDLFVIIYVIGALIFLMGSILVGVGLAGFYRNYGNASGIVAMVFSVIFPILFFILITLSFDLSFDSYYVGVEIWLAHIFAGIMLIIMGVAFLLAGKHTGRRGTGIAGGTLFIVAGSMLIPMLGLIGIAWFVLTAGAFVTAFFFAVAPAYSKYAPTAQAQYQAPQPMAQPAQMGLSTEARLEMLNRVYAEGKISDEDYMVNFEQIQSERRY